MKSALELF